ncbi:hypothetical protein RRG08_046946 [Elysia crispata]|uniref:Uncharacterized protein n=1 Tax=Elysia crispata TaxID=231223 RepID=A0AAE1DUF8_9GAST|nr:hypothetical protein RRG08_046946 [Elysia crispata]
MVKGQLSRNTATQIAIQWVGQTETRRDGRLDTRAFGREKKSQFSLCNETKLPEVQRVVSDMVGASDDGKFTKPCRPPSATDRSPVASPHTAQYAATFDNCGALRHRPGTATSTLTDARSKSRAEARPSVNKGKKGSGEETSDFLANIFEDSDKAALTFSSFSSSIKNVTLIRREKLNVTSSSTQERPGLSTLIRHKTSQSEPRSHNRTVLCG